MGSIRLFAVIVVFGALVTVFSHAPVGASFGGLDDWSPSLRAQVDPRPSIPHDPPVVAPIVDPFRPPPQPWLPGNRGLEYGPTTGQNCLACRGAIFEASVTRKPRLGRWAKRVDDRRYNGWIGRN